MEHRPGRSGAIAHCSSPLPPRPRCPMGCSVGLNCSRDPPLAGHRHASGVSYKKLPSRSHHPILFPPCQRAAAVRPLPATKQSHALTKSSLCCFELTYVTMISGTDLASSRTCLIICVKQTADRRVFTKNARCLQPFDRRFPQRRRRAHTLLTFFFCTSHLDGAGGV